MKDVAFIITLAFSIALVMAVILGKAGKDEPLKPPPIDEHETFWTKEK